MKKYKDDEIQVLGSPKNNFKPFKWIVLCVISILGLLLIYTFRNKNHLNEINTPNNITEKVTIMQNDTIMKPNVKMFTDSINDVVINIYSLHNLIAELSLEIPEKTDTTVFFVVQAADIRKDNKEIYFILKGKQLSKGKRKTGYCAIIDGKISIGNTINDEVKEYCISNQYDLFRQYPLVIDGEIQENHLKGKAIRRALAKQDNDLYIVESCNRESIYDFSEALSDMGFTHALYLVGGTSYGWWRKDSATTYDLGIYKKKPLPNTSYIIFRSIKSH